MSNQAKLKEIVRKLIKKEVEEASTSGATPGYQTPMAFSGGRKKDKKKKKDISTNSTGYNVVNEGSYEEKQIMNQLKGDDLTLQIKSSKGKTNFLKLTPEAAKKIAKIMKTMIPESVNEKVLGGKDMTSGIDKGTKITFSKRLPTGYAYLAGKTFKVFKKGINTFNVVPDGSNSEKDAKTLDAPTILKLVKNKNISKIVNSKGKAIHEQSVSESINEGRYHDYRNDESMTPKQKIGRSMREIRDSLNELNRLVKMNVRLKNELKVDSRSYWKNTHKALNKISERLVKLANKVGQLQ